jgi:hypothetical protein
VPGRMSTTRNLERAEPVQLPVIRFDAGLHDLSRGGAPWISIRSIQLRVGLGFTVADSKHAIIPFEALDITSTLEEFSAASYRGRALASVGAQLVLVCFKPECEVARRPLGRAIGG